jgi:hypothetical protein
MRMPFTPKPTPVFSCENQLMSSPARETKTEPRLDEGDGGHDRFAHYVSKADIVRSNVEGIPVVALCGKKWIPNRDPDRYPVCPTCKELMARLKSSGSN